MNLEKFITFCSIKGIITSHREMFIRSTRRRDGFSVWKIEMQARGYNAYIRYEKDNGKVRIVQTTVYDHSQPNRAYQENIALSQIQEKLLGH